MTVLDTELPVCFPNVFCGFSDTFLRFFGHLFAVFRTFFDVFFGRFFNSLILLILLTFSLQR